MTLQTTSAERVRTSFDKQGMLRAIGATLTDVRPGSVTIELRPGPSNRQQHGYVHAGAVSAIADTAAGYAAQTLMPEGRTVLTTEFKINLLAPAVGDRLVATGEVIKAGRTLTVAQSKVYALSGENQRLIALLSATLIAVDHVED
ncbi:PaaI family thioesterase (plasmid) [Sphingomonas aliaeris]|uniref:Medium/long-chain acyl-CoA thioesterase YigI n=1 Tax=Sphingomonas aliaeris TaxID=2759526 RepID=A0A974NYK4_9SPHN|nr:PaaI family thioesterase [Sphingomonas aliaeris]QQV79454.1 PaaI family thioesterase [Sphingomonas aliaeris]